MTFWFRAISSCKPGISQTHAPKLYLKHSAYLLSLRPKFGAIALPETAEKPVQFGIEGNCDGKHHADDEDEGAEPVIICPARSSEG